MNYTYQNDPTFVELIAHVIRSEGGYSNNKRDPGGATMYGVSWNNNAGWLKDNLGMKAPTDIKRLTLEQARQCYYERYWLASGGGGITDLDLAYIHLDCAINHGTGFAKKVLDGLSKNPRHYDFTGGKNRILAMTLFQEYVIKRLRAYARDKNADPNGDGFLRGWVNRTADVMENALKSIG